jgi:hypothetical protein
VTALDEGVGAIVSGAEPIVEMCERLKLDAVSSIGNDLAFLIKLGYIPCHVTGCDRPHEYEVALKVAASGPEVLLCRFHFGLMADAERIAKIVACSYQYPPEPGWPNRDWWGDWRAS